MKPQEIFEFILGDQDWKTMREFTIHGFSRATQLVNDHPEAALADIVYAVEVLKVWGWFVEAKLADAPPWSNELPWDELAKIAPWEARGIKMPKPPARKDISFGAKEEKQLSMF